VGAGDGPCVVLALGSRVGENPTHYPVDATAARHGASVARETTDPAEAYADAPAPVDGPAPSVLPSL
jgi:hypothetical protein